MLPVFFLLTKVGLAGVQTRVGLLRRAKSTLQTEVGIGSLRLLVQVSGNARPQYMTRGSSDDLLLIRRGIAPVVGKVDFRTQTSWTFESQLTKPNIAITVVLAAFPSAHDQREMTVLAQDSEKGFVSILYISSGLRRARITSQTYLRNTEASSIRSIDKVLVVVVGRKLAGQG